MLSIAGATTGAANHHEIPIQEILILEPATPMPETLTPEDMIPMPAGHLATTTELDRCRPMIEVSTMALILTGTED